MVAEAKSVGKGLALIGRAEFPDKEVTMMTLNLKLTIILRKRRRRGKVMIKIFKILELMFNKINLKAMLGYVRFGLETCPKMFLKRFCTSISLFMERWIR